MVGSGRPLGSLGKGRAWWIGRPRGIRGSAPRASVASPGSGGRYHGLAARSRRTPQRPWPHGARDKVSGARAVPGGPGAGPPGTVAARLPPTRSVPLCEYDADVSFSRPGGVRIPAGRFLLNMTFASVLDMTVASVSARPGCVTERTWQSTEYDASVSLGARVVTLPPRSRAAEPAGARAESAACLLTCGVTPHSDL